MGKGGLDLIHSDTFFLFPLHATTIQVDKDGEFMYADEATGKGNAFWEAFTHQKEVTPLFFFVPSNKRWSVCRHILAASY